jgi:hypothetical protein
MHLNSTRYDHHIPTCSSSIIMCSHIITPRSTIRYLNTMHREEIELEDEVEEDLDEEDFH